MLNKLFMLAHAEGGNGGRPKGGSGPTTMTPSQQRRYQNLLNTRGGVAAADYLKRLSNRSRTEG